MIHHPSVQALCVTLGVTKLGRLPCERVPAAKFPQSSGIDAGGVLPLCGTGASAAKSRLIPGPATLHWRGGTLQPRRIRHQFGRTLLDPGVATLARMLRCNRIYGLLCAEP